MLLFETTTPVIIVLIAIRIIHIKIFFFFLDIIFWRCTVTKVKFKYTKSSLNGRKSTLRFVCAIKNNKIKWKYNQGAGASSQFCPTRCNQPTCEQTPTLVWGGGERNPYLIDQRCEAWLSPLSNGASPRCSPVDLSGLLRSLSGWASCFSPLVVRIFDRSSKTKRFRRQQKAEATLLQWTRNW